MGEAAETSTHGMTHLQWEWDSHLSHHHLIITYYNWGVDVAHICL